MWVDAELYWKGVLRKLRWFVWRMNLRLGLYRCLGLMFVLFLIPLLWWFETWWWMGLLLKVMVVYVK